MSAYLRLKLVALVVLGAIGSVSAWAGDYEVCEITYQFEKYDVGEHADSGPFNRTTTACVASQTDCHHKAERLARDHVRQWETPPYDSGRVDVSTISVTHISMEGSCDTLD